MSDTWKRVSAREKKTMQIEKKELTWRAGRRRRSGAQANNEKSTWHLNTRKS